MKIQPPKNENYAAVVTTIKNKYPMQNLDNLIQTNILGNKVIVHKDTETGQKGIFFPVECKLSDEFLRNNSLYRHSQLNADPEQKGFFEDNCRVKALKLRGNISQGFWVPLDHLQYISEEVNNLEEGTVFDHLDGHKICEKYIVQKKSSGQSNQKKARKPKVSRLVNNQFRFHRDTDQLGRYHYVIKPERSISVSHKVHGTSAISSRILCKKKLNLFLKLLQKVGVPIENTYYDNIYSSRKMLKNDDLNKNNRHFYNEDIWGVCQYANRLLKDHISDGMTVYYEIAGLLPDTGGSIQGLYDYGCEKYSLPFKIYIYRMTYTNPTGEVFEFLPSQIEMWVEDLVYQEGVLKGRVYTVPKLFEGKCKDILDPEQVPESEEYGLAFIEELKTRFGLEDDCPICNNQVPKEGIVVRFTDVPRAESYKLKGFRFLEQETKQLDQGQQDVEEEQKEEVGDEN